MYIFAHNTDDDDDVVHCSSRTTTTAKAANLNGKNSTTKTIQQSMVGIDDDSDFPVSNDTFTQLPMPEAKKPFIDHNEVAGWSPLKHFVHIDDLLKQGGDVARRVEFVVDHFGKSRVEDVDSSARDHTSSTSSYGKRSFSSRGRGGGKSRGFRGKRASFKY